MTCLNNQKQTIKADKELEKLRQDNESTKVINNTLQEKVSSLEMQKQKLNDLRLTCRNCSKVKQLDVAFKY